MPLQFKYIFKKEIYRDKQYTHYLGFSLFRMKFVLYRIATSPMTSDSVLHEFVVFNSFKAAKTHILINYGVEL